MATQAHPLSGHTKQELEKRLAQALSEMTGINADVVLESIAYTDGVLHLGGAQMQLTATFRRPDTEDGDVPF
jgi:hypothetical protein